MKIVLTTLPNERGTLAWNTPKYFQPDELKYVPIGILSLASNIPEGNEVKILDPVSKAWSIDKTVEEIEKENPDVLGLSVMTLKAYQMTQILKKTTSPYKVVGGPHAKNYAQHILNQGADAVFRGPLADLEFAEAIENYPNVKGIIDCNTNIQKIKFPDRNLIDYEFYFSSGNLFKSNKRISMFTGIGCPHHCTFCDVQTKNIQRKKPSQILDEMIYLKSFGADSIHFIEDNFNTDEDYLKEVCDEMDKRNFYSEWSSRGEVRMSLETAKIISERGFKRIHAGIESFSDKTLRFFRKPQNFKTIEKFCQTMEEASIDVLGFLIVGAPTETEEDKKNIPYLIRELKIKHPFFSILYPLPDTEYYKNLLRDGIYKKDYWKEQLKNPVPDFKLPFPYGEKKWQEDADFVSKMIEEFSDTNKKVE